MNQARRGIKGVRPKLNLKIFSPPIHSAGFLSNQHAWAFYPAAWPSTTHRKMYSLWCRRTVQDNCITTFINPASTQTIITKTAVPVAVYLSQRSVGRQEPITENTSTTVKHLANSEYLADHVLTRCELGGRVWLHGPRKGARKALDWLIPPGWAV